MRTASAALQSFLRSRAPCWVADLFTYFLPGNIAYRWSTFDAPIVYGGQTWLGTGPILTRSRMSVRNTVEVPELELKLAATDSTLINFESIKQQIHNGIFDGARVEMDRAFMPAPGDTSLGLVLMFNGRQSQAVIDAEGVVLTAKGDNVLMNQQAPRNLYQTTCLHTFCDPGCTLNPASFTIANIVGPAGATSSFVPWGTVPANPALYILGTATFTSGSCIGQVRTIRNADGTGIYFTYPLYGVPLAGDGLSILQGCNRTQGTCGLPAPGTYDNIAHFRGYPYIPQAEYGV